MTRSVRPRHDVARRLVRLLIIAAMLSACADWTGVRDVEFEDPYIQALAGDREGGWLERADLLRRYAYLDRAFALEAEGRVDSAAVEVTRYLELKPGDDQARAYLLQLLSRLDRPRDVVDEATRLLDAHPDFVPALMARAHAYSALHRPGVAYEDMRAASRTPDALPEDSTAAVEAAARFALAWAYRLAADEAWEGAEMAYAAALGLPLDEATRVRALRGLAEAAVARDRVPRGRAALEEAIVLRPADVELRTEAALLALRAGALDAAAGHLEALLAREDLPVSRRRHALDRLAVTRERQGRYLDAAGHLERLMALDPARRSLQTLHRRLGELYFAAGRPGEAAVHLAAAADRSRGRTRVELLRRVARLREGTGDAEAAVAALRQAVLERPNDEEVQGELGRLMARTGTAVALDDTATRHGARASAERLTDEERTAARLAFGAAYEEAGIADAAVALYRDVRTEQEPGAASWWRAVERLAALHERRGEHRSAADQLMLLHHHAGNGTADDATGAAELAMRAADQYALAEAWQASAEAYRRAPSSDPPEPPTARRVAVALLEVGQAGEARRLLRSIPEAERTEQDLRDLAGLATEAGDTARAVSLYGHALERARTATDSASLYRAIGYLRNTRDDSAAVVAFRRALALEPGPAPLRLDLAGAQLRLGRADSALATLERAPDPSLAYYDLLAEVEAARGDTAGVIGALEAAADLEPTLYHLNRLAFLYEALGDDASAIVAFERAYRIAPSPRQAARLGYAYLRVGDEVPAVAWFRRAIGASETEPADATGPDLDALRREVAQLTDRLDASVYVAVRGEGAPVPLPGGATQGGVGSQGGVQLQVRPLVQRVSWGREVELVGRLFWGFDGGAAPDPDSWQGQLGVRYRPRWLPGSALGVERWVALGSAARDAWGTRLQYSRLLGTPYPEYGDGPSPYGSLYGDAAYLFDRRSLYTLYAEGRSGLAIPVGRHTTLRPHGAVVGYHQGAPGAELSYIEGGPGLGLRLRLPRDGRYTKDHWSLGLAAQYRWGAAWDAGDDGAADYGQLVLTLVLEM